MTDFIYRKILKIEDLIDEMIEDVKIADRSELHEVFYGAFSGKRMEKITSKLIIFTEGLQERLKEFSKEDDQA